MNSNRFLALKELQASAASSGVTTLELLRKALQIAHELEMPDDIDWIQKELVGYGDGTVRDDFPDYRKLHIELVAEDPPFGWKPFIIQGNHPFGDSLLKINVATSLISLSELIETKGDMIFPLPDDVNNLFEQIDSFSEAKPRIGRKISNYQIKALNERVRVRILNWCITASKSFDSNPDQYSALQSPVTNNYYIGNAQGVIGGTHTGTIHQSNVINEESFSALKSILQANKVAEEDIENLRAAIQSDPPSPTSSDKFGPRVNGWMGRMLSKASSGLWDITVSTAGSVLSTVVNGYYGL